MPQLRLRSSLFFYVSHMTSSVNTGRVLSENVYFCVTTAGARRCYMYASARRTSYSVAAQLKGGSFCIMSLRDICLFCVGQHRLSQWLDVHSIESFALLRLCLLYVLAELDRICVFACVRMEHNYVWSRTAALVAMETCTIAMPQLRLRARRAPTFEARTQLFPAQHSTFV